MSEEDDADEGDTGAQIEDFESGENCAVMQQVYTSNQVLGQNLAHSQMAQR